MSGPAELYMDFLSGEGYRPTIDNDGDVVFKVEGGLYYIDVDADDAVYFRVVYPNFWSIENPDEIRRRTSRPSSRGRSVPCSTPRARSAW